MLNLMVMVFRITHQIQSSTKLSFNTIRSLEIKTNYTWISVLEGGALRKNFRVQVVKLISILSVTE
jgi:hypothetical protein